MILPIKIGSRQSPLAKIQVQEILSLINLAHPYELINLKTQGDIDKKTSLSSNPADNFFTNTLDEALLDKRIDLTIHSAKDLPKDLPEGLAIYALTKPLDESDSWVSPYALENLPAGAKIGTSSPLRGQMIKALAPQAILTDIRGTIEERLAMLDAKIIDGLIIATCALKRLNLEHRIKSLLPWEAAPLQGQLAIVGRAEDHELAKIFEPIDIRRHYGHVYLVGAGPGDPELITLKAIKALKEADCVIYDYLVDPSLLKYAPRAEQIYAGKRKGNHSLPQAAISSLLRQKALEGKVTVRLKGGDPLIFGRGADEISYLRSYHIPVSVIPGISSATSIPSSLGVPLTARGISTSVAFVSGHGEAEDNQSNPELTVPRADTIVFLMGLTKLNQITTSLTNAGWTKEKPIMIISNGTKSTQRVIKGTLGTIEGLLSSNPLEAPALIVAGDTVNFYKQNKTKVFLHCGTHPENYLSYGQMIPWPMIDLKTAVLNETEQQKLVSDFKNCDFVILTSPNSVIHFTKTMLNLLPLSVVQQKIYVVIGRATAELLECSKIMPHLISSEETAQGLFKLLHQFVDLKGKKILLPRSSLPNPFLKESLIKEGAQVIEWTIYENIKPPKRPLPAFPIDGIIFTSPSTLKNFLEDYGTIPDSWQIYAKGPVTEKALIEAGYQPSKVGV